MRTTTYKQAGVDLEAADEIEDIIRKIIEKYHTPQSNYKYVIGGIGGFAGAFNLGAFLRDQSRIAHGGER